MLLTILYCIIVLAILLFLFCIYTVMVSWALGSEWDSRLSRSTRVILLILATLFLWFVYTRIRLVI